ncbi:MAG: hypothetical protein ABW061_01085, partial [Polyangiaceae bacterium]
SSDMGPMSAAGAPEGGSAGLLATAGAPTAGSPAAGTGAAGSSTDGGSGGGSECTKCPDACCALGSVCVDDGSGSLSCKKSCTGSRVCPSASPCCVLQPDGTGICGDGSEPGAKCRCTNGDDCDSGACAPRTDIAGNPVGPYICVPNDGGSYHGCSGLLTSCGSGTCCFTDARDNQFCASQCINNSQCGNASCNTYSNANTTCSGMLGCGPKP